MSITILKLRYKKVVRKSASVNLKGDMMLMSKEEKGGGSNRQF